MTDAIGGGGSRAQIPRAPAAAATLAAMSGEVLVGTPEVKPYTPNEGVIKQLAAFGEETLTAVGGALLESMDA